MNPRIPVIGVVGAFAVVILIVAYSGTSVIDDTSGEARLGSSGGATVIEPLVIELNDIIIEVQKTPVKSSSDLKRLVDNIFKKGEKTLLLTVINQNNQRRYLGVKIN